MNLLDLARSAIADLPTVEVGARFRWRVHRPGLPPLEVCFSPERTEIEVREQYREATIIEPLPEFPVQIQLGNFPTSPQEVGPTDDRRTCEQCANLSRHRGRDGFRRCAAARRGELPYHPGKDYSPATDYPKRCEGYSPLPADPDQRRGTERWPELRDNRVEMDGATDVPDEHGASEAVTGRPKHVHQAGD